MVVRGFYIPLLARMAAAFAVTIAERIYVYYDDASDRFLAPWPRWARDAFVDPVVGAHARERLVRKLRRNDDSPPEPDLSPRRSP